MLSGSDDQSSPPVQARNYIMNSSLHEAQQQANEIILGKENAIRLALCCLLARGHLLIEDIPGVGKTTLAHTLARVLGLDFQRVQFTSDLLPGDILGVSVFEQQGNSGQFVFHEGPIFSQLVLADEVNRASPKTQSALLEAMEERQITADGHTRPLPEPFFVIATQNPQYQIGTFPLPESQLDRFLMRIELGYPPERAEKELLAARSRRDILKTLQPRMSSSDLMALQSEVEGINCSPALLDYILAIVKYSRESGRYREGLSPRAGLALRNAAQAWALLDGRDMALPEDVQAVAPAVVSHRLQPTDHDSPDTHLIAEQLLKAVPIP